MAHAVLLSSDGDESSRSSSSDSDEDDDDESRGKRGSDFLDVEAQESDDDDDSSTAESSLDAAPRRRAFPKFMQLPPELRSRVWELFCPDLVTKARFLQFDLAPASAAAMMRSSVASMWTVRDKVFLSDQTDTLRSLMAVHRESREKGLHVYPHTLALDIGDGNYDGIVRFNKHLDVVFVDGIEHLHRGTLSNEPGFAENIVNLVVVGWVSESDQWASAVVRAALPLFPNIQRLYIWYIDYELRKRDLRWAVSDCVHQYLMQTFEKEPGLGEDTQTIACWPDVHRHPDFAKLQIPPIHLRRRPPEIDSLVQRRGIHLWPIVTFELGSGMTRYEKLLKVKDIPYHDEHLDSSDDSSGPSSTSFPDTSEDEYESEGIDDNEIVQDDDDSSEDDLIPFQLSDVPISGAMFSSPESDTANEDASSPAEPELPRRPPKRRIVTDSDDDDSPASDEPVAKRARVARPTVVDSDDETDHEMEQRSQGGDPRRRTINISDPESDGDSGGAEADSEDGATDISDGDSDSNPPQQRASLAERLQAHREAHPVPASDEEEDSTEDEDNDDDEDSSDEDGGGLIDRMASESEGDDNESEEDW